MAYYNRQGEPITWLEWSAAFRDKDLWRVAETTLPNGRRVSTVWLGLDHRFGHGQPLIFETLVFPSQGEWDELDGDRYTTEEEALAGHQALCDKWSDEGRKP